MDWNKLSGITCVPRRKLQSDWNDDDLEIGTEVTHDGQQMAITGIIVLGGKFLAAEGGNRPSFVSGGVQGDTSREVYGSFMGGDTKDHPAGVYSGAFRKEEPWAELITQAGAYGEFYKVSMQSSRVVPTGLENSPRTLSVRYWRRIA